MVRSAIACLLFCSAPLWAQPDQARLKPHPAAMEIFESDWVLMNWALKYYDSNHDLLVDPAEAQVAAEAFRKLADADGDGRITTEEFRDARAFILARY